jgi:SET domain
MALKRELQLGNESMYAPYVDYLLHETDDYTIPSRYSRQGQQLLLQVVDDVKNTGDTRIPPVEPISWLSEDWIKYCRADPADKLGIKAATAVLQRSDDAILIPGYDSYNHRNGKWTNTNTKEVTGKYYMVLSSRDIQQGEELFNSYNFCQDCGGRKKLYGTPGELQVSLLSVVNNDGSVAVVSHRFLYYFSLQNSFGTMDLLNDSLNDGMFLSTRTISGIWTSTKTLEIM